MLQLTLQVPASGLPQAESLLKLAGATVVSLADAAESPLFEPGVGETPLWPVVNIAALFENPIDTAPLVAVLEESLRCDIGAHAGEIVADDWRRGLEQTIAPIRIADNFEIVPAEMPSHDRNSDSAECRSVRLNMGLAFGTGRHPTTILCLEWLAAHPLQNKTLYDLGCGSGILALTALAFGATHAFASDTDPQAIVATKRNAALNAHDDKITVDVPVRFADLQVDLVVANILSGTLIELAPTIAMMTRPLGKILLSGILTDQIEATAAAFAPSFSHIEATTRDGWARIVATRNATESSQFR